MELSSSNETDQSTDLAGITASLVLGSAFLIGVPGNFLVIWIILCTMRQRSPTVVLILNLAVADFLVLITLPLWIYAFLNSWDFGQAMCKIISYIVCCNMYISVFLIMMMSIDRFLAVLYPFVIQKWRKNHVVVKTVLVVWILAFLFSIPILLVQEIDTDPSGNQQCFYRNYSSDGQQKAVQVLEIVVSFAIPFTVLTVCYVCIVRKIKQMNFTRPNNTGKVIVSIMVAFFICWVPHHLVNMISTTALLMKNSDKDMSDALENAVEHVVHIVGALTFINSCVNPILYAFAARKFQSGLRASSFARLFDQLTHSIKDDSRRETVIKTGTEISLTMQEMHSLQTT
eukprot:gi/632944942/ref/XP_007887776.1/ PREDICTED: C3a anaphylatoxin chemotactic receptor-like [Callorhinchus milii]